MTARTHPRTQHDNFGGAFRPTIKRWARAHPAMMAPRLMRVTALKRAARADTERWCPHGQPWAATTESFEGTRVARRRTGPVMPGRA